MIPYLILTTTLAAALGWCIGHAMRRPPSRVWACQRCDTQAIDQAFMAEQRGRHDETMARYDNTRGSA